MKEDLRAYIGTLKEASLKEIRRKYAELFGAQGARGRHRTNLLRKIAYRLQELESGGLTNAAKERLEELIEKYDPVNNAAFRPQPAITKTSSKDRRLPIPGTVITKAYKGAKYEVRVLERGFEYNGKIYNSLSAIAKEITGAHWNGYLFFNL
jgi:hypothetical protein